MSQPRQSRRASPVEPDELEAPPPRGRQAWLALLVTGILIAAVAGSGLLIKHAIEPPQDDQRQDHLAVFRLLVVASKEIRY